MKRAFRLTRSDDFKRVRRFGKAYAHPFLVLCVQPADGDGLQIGLSASKAIGGAVQRNRVKRVLRAVLHANLTRLKRGWTIVLVARQPLTIARFPQVSEAVLSVLQRAQLLRDDVAEEKKDE